MATRKTVRDYLTYAGEHGHTVQFLAPPQLPPGERENWRTVITESLQAVDLNTVDDVLSFHDSYQIQLELVRSEAGTPTRDIDTLLCLSDKTRFKAHSAVRDHITRHLQLPPSLRAPEALALVQESLTFPIMLKPSNGFYSAGVVKVDDPEGFAKAHQQTKRVCAVLRRSAGESWMLAEEYLDGNEYAIDGMVSGGRLIPLRGSIPGRPRSSRDESFGTVLHQAKRRMRHTVLGRSAGFRLVRCCLRELRPAILCVWLSCADPAGVDGQVVVVDDVEGAVATPTEHGLARGGAAGERAEHPELPDDAEQWPRRLAVALGSSTTPHRPAQSRSPERHVKPSQAHR